MAFCPKCGASVAEGSGFCGSCGAQTAAPGPSASSGAGGLTSNVAAALTYVLGFITGIIFLVLEPYKDDKFVRFHAFQSIFFCVAVLAFWIIWNTVLFSGTFSFMILILAPLSFLISLAIFGFWLFLMYKAYNNERFMIPVVGEMAAKQAG